jgi:hypothetical protein
LLPAVVAGHMVLTQTLTTQNLMSTLVAEAVEAVIEVYHRKVYRLQHTLQL